MQKASTYIFVLFFVLSNFMMAVTWQDETRTEARFLDFFRWVQQNKPKDDKTAITFYTMIETIEGKVTPVPAPLQCKDANSRVGEMVVSLSRSAFADKRTALLVNAYAVVDIPPNTRAQSDFEKALKQMTDAGFDVNAMKTDLIAIKNGFFNTHIDKLYDEYADKIHTKMLKVFGEQKELLKGTLKDKDFVYYEMLSINGKSYPHIIAIGTKTKEFELFKTGKCAVGKIIKKGTEVFSRNKYLQYSGDITTDEMFKALQRTGWNMKNITSKDNLEKK